MMATSGPTQHPSPVRRRDGDVTAREDERGLASPDSLVDSPRWILTQKTNMNAFPSTLSLSLEYFYDELVELSPKRHHSAVSKAEAIMDYIMPRVKKLANQKGMKITRHVNAGSTFDDTQVMLPYDVDVFVLFDRSKASVDSLDPGYRVIPLKKFRPQAGSPPDQWRYGRPEDGVHLSSRMVAEYLHNLAERALKLHPQTELQPFSLEDGKSPITVLLKKKFNINLIPATYLDSEETYLLARPYSYDKDPASDKAWRMSFIASERKIMERIDQADRGMRRKAFKTLKTLVRVEPSLSGLTSYHVKTTLLHTFDSTVDQTPRWQRTSLETCFLALLKELHYYLNVGNMPHFFVRGYNLLGDVPRRVVGSARTRVGYLLANHNELIRVLRKRAQ